MKVSPRTLCEVAANAAAFICTAGIGVTFAFALMDAIDPDGTVEELTSLMHTVLSFRLLLPIAVLPPILAAVPLYLTLLDAFRALMPKSCMNANP